MARITNPTAAFVWTEFARNLNTNPRMDNSTAGWLVAGPGLTQTAAVGGTRIDAPTALGANFAFFYQNPAINTVPGDERSASVEVSVPLGYPTVTLEARIHAYGSEIAMGIAAPVMIAAGETKTIKVASTIAAPAATWGVRMILASRNNAGGGVPAGARMIIRNAGLYNTRVPLAFFSGATAATAEHQYAWVGAANATESIEKSRSYTELHQVEPTLVLSADISAELASTVHPILGSQQVNVTLAPASLRTGILALLCEDVDVATDVFNLHRRPARLHLEGSDNPDDDMVYIAVGGRVTKRLDNQDVPLWIVEVPFHEVSI